MPLLQSSSKAALRMNIAELIKAGHKPDQAAAVAYKILREQGGNDKTKGASK